MLRITIKPVPPWPFSLKLAPSGCFGCQLPAGGCWGCQLHAACCLDCLMVNRLLVTSAAYAVRLVRWTAHNGDSYTAAPRSSRWCTRRLCNSWCNTARATFLDGFKLVCCCVFCTLVWSCVFATWFGVCQDLAYPLHFQQLFNKCQTSYAS